MQSERVESVEHGVADDGPEVRVQAPMAVAVGSPRGLHALDYLLHHRRADLEEVVDHVAAMETGLSPAELGSFERRLIGLSLRRVHLPALDRRGLITWDPERRQAALPAAVRDESVSTLRSPSRHRRYLTLALVQLTVVGLATLNVPPLATLDPLAAVAVGTAVLFLMALYELVTRMD